jgi:hypothetical protein
VQPPQARQLRPRPWEIVGVAVVLGLDADREGVRVEVGVGLAAGVHELPDMAVRRARSRTPHNEMGLDTCRVAEVVPGAQGRAHDGMVNDCGRRDSRLAVPLRQELVGAAMRRTGEADQSHLH